MMTFNGKKTKFKRLHVQKTSTGINWVLENVHTTERVRKFIFTKLHVKCHEYKALIDNSLGDEGYKHFEPTLGSRCKYLYC